MGPPGEESSRSDGRIASAEDMKPPEYSILRFFFLPIVFRGASPFFAGASALRIAAPAFFTILLALCFADAFSSAADLSSGGVAAWDSSATALFEDFFEDLLLTFFDTVSGANVTSPETASVLA